MWQGHFIEVPIIEDQGMFSQEWIRIDDIEAIHELGGHANHGYLIMRSGRKISLGLPSEAQRILKFFQ